MCLFIVISYRNFNQIDSNFKTSTYAKSSQRSVKTSTISDVPGIYTYVEKVTYELLNNTAIVGRGVTTFPPIEITPHWFGIIDSPLKTIRHLKFSEP